MWLYFRAKELKNNRKVHAMNGLHIAGFCVFLIADLKIAGVEPTINFLESFATGAFVTQLILWWNNQ